MNTAHPLIIYMDLDENGCNTKTEITENFGVAAFILTYIFPPNKFSNSIYNMIIIWT